MFSSGRLTRCGKVDRSSLLLDIVRYTQRARGIIEELLDHLLSTSDLRRENRPRARAAFCAGLAAVGADMNSGPQNTTLPGA